MKCIRCGNEHDDPHHKQCAYCRVSNSTHYWHVTEVAAGVEEQARSACAEALSEARDMADGGWIE